MTLEPNQHQAYQFGLSDAQEERARRLHGECIVVDMLSQHAGGSIFSHYPPRLQPEINALVKSAMSGLQNGSQALAEVMYWPYEVAKRGDSELLCEWLLASGLTCGTYDIGVYEGEDPVWRTWEGVNGRYRDLPWVRYVTTTQEIRAAKQDQAIAFLANCQPESPAPRSLRAFDAAYARGLRSFMLTYNRMDHIGIGCTERIDAGLSNYGIEVVRHCNALGIVVDVSHCCHRTTMDACQYSRRPVTANHTSAGRLYFHARAKSDEALRAIADTDGVIGVLAVPFFLTDAAGASIDHMLDHIEYIADLVGWRHVGLGTDWPLQAPDELTQLILSPDNKPLGFRSADGIEVTRRLAGLEDCRDLPNVTRGLVKRGFDDEQIRGILGENAMRVYDAVFA